MKKLLLICLLCLTCLTGFTALADPPFPLIPQYYGYYRASAYSLELTYNQPFGYPINTDIAYQGGYCFGAMAAMNIVYLDYFTYFGGMNIDYGWLVQIDPSSLPYPLTTDYKASYYNMASSWLFYAGMMYGYPDAVNQCYYRAGYYTAIADTIDYFFNLPPYVQNPYDQNPY